MERWPLLLSVPHMGSECPPELASYNRLTPEQIIQDGDQFAVQLYAPLKDKVEKYIAAQMARAFVDLNRREDDFSLDGVIKTHTCFNEVIYHRPLPPELIQQLLRCYYQPYHRALTQASQLPVRLAIDCHTMLDRAPVIGSDAGKKRPDICISPGGQGCPMGWVKNLKKLFEVYVEDVRINDPFKGGYITVSHGQEMPWLQLEWNRSTEKYNNENKALIMAKVLERLVKIF